MARGRLALGVPSVHWVLPEVATTTMLRNAENVNWVKQQQLKGQPRVTRVTLVNLAKPKVFVPRALLGFTKTTKVNNSAVTLVPHLRKYPTTKAPVVNCHRGVPAKWVNI